MAVERRMLCSALVLIAMLVPLVISSRRFSFDPQSSTEKLEDGDPLYIVANKVLSYEAPWCRSIAHSLTSVSNSTLPLSDPSSYIEQFSYFSFPFCPPGEPIANKKSSLEEVLAGDCQTITKYDFRFMEKTENKILREKSTTKDELARLKFAIERDFFCKMAYNNFVLRGNVGLFETEWSSLPLPRYLLFTHIDFRVSYLENNVTSIDIVSVPYNVDITEAVDTKVNFSYSVYWNEAKRADVVSLPLNETLYYKGRSET